MAVEATLRQGAEATEGLLSAPLEGMARTAGSPVVRPLEGEDAVASVIEAPCLPTVLVVAAQAVDLAVGLGELTAVGIGVASLAGERQARELEPSLLALRVLAGVAFRATLFPVSSREWPAAPIMVEGDVVPALHPMAARASIVARVAVELASMRVLVAARAN